MNYSSRLIKLFSLSNLEIMKIYENEIKRLIPILNKIYNQKVTLDYIVFDEISPLKETSDSLLFLSGFGLSNGKYLLGVHPFAINYQWNDKSSRYSKIYKNIGLFIKDCACHELFHLYDYVIHGKLGKHDDWWINNYNPEYAKRVLARNVTGHDFRSDYTNKDIIFGDSGNDEVFTLKRHYKDGDKIYLTHFIYTEFKL